MYCIVLNGDYFQLKVDTMSVSSVVKVLEDPFLLETIFTYLDCVSLMNAKAVSRFV